MRLCIKHVAFCWTNSYQEESDVRAQEKVGAGTQTAGESSDLAASWGAGALLQKKRCSARMNNVCGKGEKEGTVVVVAVWGREEASQVFPFLKIK